MLTVVTAVVLVAACGAPMPTALERAPEEAVGVEPRGGRDVASIDRPPAVDWGPAVSAGWVILIDGVGLDDPTHARRLAELDNETINRLEVIKGVELLKHLYPEAMKPLGEDARGVTEIFTRRGGSAAPTGR